MGLEWNEWQKLTTELPPVGRSVATKTPVGFASMASCGEDFRSQPRTGRASHRGLGGWRAFFASRGTRTQDLIEPSLLQTPVAWKDCLSVDLSAAFYRCTTEPIPVSGYWVKTTLLDLIYIVWEGTMVGLLQQEGTMGGLP